MKTLDLSGMLFKVMRWAAMGFGVYALIFCVVAVIASRSRKKAYGST